MEGRHSHMETLLVTCFGFANMTGQLEYYIGARRPRERLSVTGRRTGE